MKPEGEAVPPELEALIAVGNDTPQTWAVYADWLEEKGDPRGTLMRLDPSSTAHSDLVDQHWPRWFGEIPREAFSQLTWANGFVSRAAIRNPISETLFKLHSMKFVRELSIELPFNASVGLNALARLHHLRASMSWRDSLTELRPTLEKMASIELALAGAPEGGELGVLTWQLTALQHFVLDAPRLPTQTVRLLAEAPWIRQIKSLTVCGVDREIAMLMIERAEPFAAIGAGLHLQLSPRGGAQREQLRRSFPLARLQHSNRSVDLPFRERGPWAITQPRDAPANYLLYPAQLTPLRTIGTRGTADIFVSSGALMNDPLTNQPESRSCAWCASDRTLVIFAQFDGETRFGRALWIREWRCEECERITTTRFPTNGS